MSHGKYAITSKTTLASGITQFELAAPLIARKNLPGQFLILRLNDEGERIPLTIVEADPEQGTVKIIIQEVGKTTRQLGRMDVGDQIRDVVGPLGNPSEIRMFGTIIIVGGGVGTALAYPEAKALKAIGNRIITIIGARNRDLLVLETAMRLLSDEFYITTDDGTKGRRGFVTDVLAELLVQDRMIDRVLAIGPTIMMKAVAEATRPYGVKTVVSLNTIMLDGTGMCGACRVTVDGQTRFACVDGPEFDAHKVDFDELMTRLRMYTEEECRALQRFDG